MEQPVQQGGGRRREALLRFQADHALAQRLTAADVETLQRDPSPESRALVAGKFGQQFEELAQSAERELALAVLQLLVRDPARAVRQRLAETLAASPHLPTEVALTLARDELEVARPLLERSPVLTDEALIELLRGCSILHAFAVARRARLPESVAAALADTREPQVVAALLANGGAALSQRTLERILRDHRNDGAVEDRLAQRADLPPEVIEQLVTLIGHRLDWELLTVRTLPPEDARAIRQALRERAVSGITAREHGERQYLERLQVQLDLGELGHEALLRFLKEADIAGLELGLALHARLEPMQTRRLLYGSERRNMAALCIRAGFTTPHYVALRLALDLIEAAGADAARATYSAETIRYLQVEYERLRWDEPKLRELIGG